MKNFKKISIVVVALNCLVETSSASLNPNYADDANVSIQSTSSGSGDLFAQLQARMKSKLGGQNSPASGSQDELKAKIKAKMQSMSGDQGSSSAASGSQDELKAKLKAKMQSMSGDKEQSSDLKSSIMAKLKAKGVNIQSIEPQELPSPAIEILPPAFAAPAEQAINPLEETLAVEVAEEPSIELETTLVPANSALNPVLIPGADEEITALPVQDVSQGELVLEPSENLVTPEEEIEPALDPVMEISNPLTNQDSEELDESIIDAQPATTSVNQFLTEDEDDSDSEDQVNELDSDESDLAVDTQPAVTSINQFLAEDEDDSENLSIPTSDTTGSMESADVNIEEAPSIPEITVDPIEIPTKEVDTGIENEIMIDDTQDQPEEIIVPVVPSEPVEVPAVAMNSEDDLIDTINDNQVIVVKVYPVLDAMYSAAQSVKAAALDMINYVFNKAKAARKKAKKDLIVIETDLKNVE